LSISSLNLAPRNKGIYYDFNGVYRIKRNNLVGTSPGLKNLSKKILSSTSKRTTQRLKNLLRKTVENPKKMREMLPVSGKKPLNIHKVPSPTDSTKSASRNFNIFDTD